jgi:hypothetical protein
MRAARPRDQVIEKLQSFGSGMSRGAWLPRRSPLILDCMEFADSYVVEVDRLLAAAASLFPTEQQLAELQQHPAPAADLPEGGSGLAAAAEQAAQSYRTDDARAASLSGGLHDVVRQVSAQAQQDGASALAIRQTASAGARAVVGEGSAPHNLVLLVSHMDDRLRAMQEQLDTTRARFETAAQQIQAHGADMAAIRQR